MPLAAGKLETDMRVKFNRDRDWTPPEERRITVAYKQGMELTIKREWGEQMVKDGDAVEIDPPARETERKPLTPAQHKALDHDGDDKAGGSLPKAKA